MPDNEQDSEDLTTAAARLGLTAETIRKRLQRGKLKGFKAADGTWRVTLDKQQDSPEQPAGQEQDSPGQEQDKPGQDHNAVIAILTDQVEFLRKQLETRDQAHSEALQRRDEEIRRVHVLLQQEQQQVKALTDQRGQAQRPWWYRLMGWK